MTEKPTGAAGRRRGDERRSFARAICLLIAVLGTVVLAIGCGSDATKHYANVEYGFSFDYPASVTVTNDLRRVLISTWGKQEGEFGLFLCDADADPDRLWDNYLDVLVSSADHELTTGEAEAALQTRLSDLQERAANPQWGIDILESSITTQAGVSALEVTYDCDFVEAQRTERIWRHVFMKGRYTYLVEYIGRDESFDQDVEQFRPIVDSVAVK